MKSVRLPSCSSCCERQASGVFGGQAMRGTMYTRQPDEAALYGISQHCNTFECRAPFALLLNDPRPAIVLMTALLQATVSTRARAKWSRRAGSR